MREYLNGIWKAEIEGKIYDMSLPGTLDESGIGNKDLGKNQWHPDAVEAKDKSAFDENAPIATRFTRKVTYEGAAKISKALKHPTPAGMRLFLHVERARALRLYVGGTEVNPVSKANISTPYEFEVTDLLEEETNVVFISDNSYPGWPHDSIVNSSAATDETQTNWNGLIGEIYLEERPSAYVSEMLVFTVAKDNVPERVKLVARINSDSEKSLLLCVRSEALAKQPELVVNLKKGVNNIEIGEIPLCRDVILWDEGQGSLYTLNVTLGNNEAKQFTFGIRSFGDNGKGRLALNGRTIFLRSEANCAEFPETGHAPMTVSEWTEILKLYRSYGVNCMRFHSHVPPKAAFIAADRLGMMMQPELSHWNPKNAFETDESYEYYKAELCEVIRDLNNHPSFVMLTFGNELHAGEAGHKHMDDLLELAHSLDGTRLYANGSNPHYGELGADKNSDFYTSQNSSNLMMRGTSAGMKGHINQNYPSAAVDYDPCMTDIRKTYDKPVFSFEVGQFEVLPDFDELAMFKGISLPVNYEIIKEKAEKAGFIKDWKKIVEATGELALIGYREEVEAAMRTEKLSGISLLSLQDFPGQGTALVGMLNSHLQPKPFSFANPERFERFFRDTALLCKLPRYTYEDGETLEADVVAANYGKTNLHGDMVYKLQETGGEKVYGEGRVSDVECPCGQHTYVGKIRIILDSDKAVRCDLIIRLGEAETTYPVWIYPKKVLCCHQNVIETKVLNEDILSKTEAGATVFFAPEATKEALPNSIKTQFTTDFWSVGTFPFQDGGMGQLIEENHRIFKDFPTEFHTNYQWWPMATARSVILPDFRCVHSIVTELDSYATMRPMSMLFECKVGKGRLLVSSMDLSGKTQYPEARALLAAIYDYLASEEFCPKEECTVETLKGIFAV